MTWELPENGLLRRIRLLGLIAAAVLATGLTGCAGMGDVSEKMSQSMSNLPAVGLPANAPERPAQTMAYPAVHDMPPPRTTAVMTAQEQRNFEQELIAARNSQPNGGPSATAAAARAAPPPPPPPPRAASKPAPAVAAPVPRTTPVSSNQMIY